MITTEKFRVAYNSRKLFTTLLYRDDVYSLTPRHSEYNCRKVIYDSLYPYIRAI